MKRPYAQLILLLMTGITSITSSAAWANLQNDSPATIQFKQPESAFKLSTSAELTNSNLHVLSRIVPVHLAGDLFGSYSNSNNKQYPYTATRQIPLTSIPTHVVYTQSRPWKVDPKIEEVYTGYVSGKGRTPQDILNQHQEKHQSLINEGFSQPKYVAHHRIEYNAQKQSHYLQLNSWDHNTVGYDPELERYNESDAGKAELNKRLDKVRQTPEYIKWKEERK